MMVTHKDGMEKEPVSALSFWMRVEVLAFVCQTLVLLAGLIYGYSKLESKVDEISRRVNEHIATHNAYLLRETWDVRNRFIDGKLDSIERKLDLLLDQNGRKK